MASMGSRGDAYYSAAAESFMATIKTELIYRNRFKTKDEARFAVFIFDAYIVLLRPLEEALRLGSQEPGGI